MAATARSVRTPANVECVGSDSPAPTPPLPSHALGRRLARAPSQLRAAAPREAPTRADPHLADVGLEERFGPCEEIVAAVEDDELRAYAERRIVLSAIELKQWDTATEVAKGSTAQDGDPWWELIVVAAQGDAAAAAPLMAKLVELGYETDRFWHSPHIAEALEKNPAFAELKKQYPHEDH